MNDQELITAVRQSVHGVRMNVPAEQIVSRSRAIRASGHRRLAAGITAAAAAGSVVLGLGLTGVFGAAPARSTGTTGTAATARSTGTIRTAAFTLTRNANGTVTLRLTERQMFDPAALQGALAQDGIRAVVKTDTYCWSSPAAPNAGDLGVLTHELPNGTPIGPPSAGKIHFPPGFTPADTVTVINPAKMPSGTELFFSYFDNDSGLYSNLIYTSSYTCNTGPQPEPPAIP